MLLQSHKKQQVRILQQTIQVCWTLTLQSLHHVPSQLLENRWDIQKAESQLEAARLDVKVAKANFYPVFRITGGICYEAFNPKLIISSPESMIFSAAGTLVAPLINRSEVNALYLAQVRSKYRLLTIMSEQF